MTKKIFLALAALTALTLCFSSCKQDNPGKNKPKSKTETRLKIEPKGVIKVLVGKTAKLTITVDPADTKYTCESANADIATVSDQGVITGVKPGKTVITVKAGETTKTADVEVLDANALDESRFIGKPDEKGLIAPFYAPEFESIEDLKDLIKTANKSKGWMFNEDLEIQGGRALDVQAPYGSDNKYTDDRLIGEIAYIYAPGDRSKSFIAAFLKAQFDEDPLKKLVKDKDEKIQQYFFSIAAAYGFDKKQMAGELDGNAGYCAVAYNMDQFSEGPYEMMFLSFKNDKGKFMVKLQISKRGPQSQSNLAKRTPMMPELQLTPSLKAVKN